MLASASLGARRRQQAQQHIRSPRQRQIRASTPSTLVLLSTAPRSISSVD